MVDPVSIPEAARALGLSAARVRNMAAHGQLDASKIGDRWLVERAAVEERRRREAVVGRPFAPRNAWALLLLASGKEVEGIDPSVRSRLRRALRVEGLQELAPRLARRAEVRSYNAHPGEVSYLFKRSNLIRSGISAAGAYKLDIVSGKEVDGYIRESSLRSLVKRHVLSEAGSDGNVRLRVVDKESWPFLAGARIAPLAAVALDLAEDPDPRSARAGRKALMDLDRRYKAS
jgi:excisionase family DNA binding protein